MLNRRDLLKGAAVGLTLAARASEASAQPAPTVFAGATAKFRKADQHVLPPWAFRDELPTPPTARPRKVAAFADLLGKPVFGPSDATPVGEAFHGTASEFAETPDAWREIGCTPTGPGAMRGDGWAARAATAWEDKRKHFGDVLHVDHCPDGPVNEAVYEDANRAVRDPAKRVANWGHFPVKCYKLPIVELSQKLVPDAAFPARLYGYAGQVPGPLLKFRHGQPAVVRFENHLEAEVSVHLHGGHTPSHSDGFPSFYVLQGKARDYFYPNVIPLKRDGRGGVEPELGESLSTMWYHDHGMDATAFNVSKGLAGMAMFFTDWELRLIRDGVLPGLGKASCHDPDEAAPADAAEEGRRRQELEDPDRPGCYKPGREPFHNPYDLPLVLQDKVVDPATGQVAYDGDAHNGYLGNTFFVNGVAWPVKHVVDRKYRLRVLNGSNARIYRLRLLSEADFLRSQRDGLTAEQLDAAARPYWRIGKDSCLWGEPFPVKSLVLAMANRADLIVDFGDLFRNGGGDGREQVYYLVNTMPQFDGRGPKGKLDDGGDPRVLPLPFDVPGRPPAPELDRPIALLKFVVGPQSAEQRKVPEAKVAIGVALAPVRPKIPDADVRVVREFIFERGNAAWQVNGRFYDPAISNACPSLVMTDTAAEEWVLRNGGGGWWHPIHIHLESHQLVTYEKDFEADDVVDRADPPTRRRLRRLEDVTSALPPPEIVCNHDTQVLGPNTVVRIRMRFRTWPGPFVFHCHNLEHEDVRMMGNFEPVPGPGHDPNVAPAARTHGNRVTLNGRSDAFPDGRVGELDFERPPVPGVPLKESGEPLIPTRPTAGP